MDNVEKLANYLQGTCKTLDEACEHFDWEEGQLDELLPELDNHIFLCEVCGWWCELCEMSESEEGVCVDCHGGE